MNDIKTQTKSDTESTILIQEDLPVHKINTGAAVTAHAISKEKWSFLKSDLKSALSGWAELEKQAPQKTPEEEQLEKMRNLISNIKDRLREF